MNYSTDLVFNELHEKIYGKIKGTMEGKARNAKSRKDWEAYHLLDFATSIRDSLHVDRKKRENLYTTLENENLSFDHLQSRTCDGYMTWKSNAIFDCIAKALDTPPLICFLQFLEFCREESRPLSVFDNTGKTAVTDGNGVVISTTLDDLIIDIKGDINNQLKKLLDVDSDVGTNTSEQTACYHSAINEQPKDCIQDIVTINNEIEKLRKYLGLYPYGKNKARVFNHSKAEIALSKIDQLLHASPNNADLLALKAVVLSGLGKLNEALELSQELYAKNSTHLRAAVTHGAVLNKLKRHNDALSICEKAKTLHPHSFPVAVHMGSTLRHLGRYEDSIKEYTRAASLDKEDVMPLYHIASIHYKFSKNKECEALLKKALYRS